MKKIRFGEILNYWIALELTVVFALFLSGRAGWFFVLVFLLAPLVSAIVTFILCRFVSLESKCRFTATVNKGDIVSMPVEIVNKSILPLPPIVLELEDSPSVSCIDRSIRVSVMPLGSESFEIYFKAEIAGKSRVGIRSARIRDYLGIFSFRLKSVACENLSVQIGVIPDIEDISAENEVINGILEMAVHSVDSEDTTERGQHTFGGFPGYDSREYIPGDPLKRINWKLSAKRNTLLIRLDDETISSPVSVVLDSVLATENTDMDCRQALLLAQKTMEASLGIAKSLYLNGCIVNYFIKTDDGWEKYTVNSDDDITEISLALADYSFSTREGERIPYEYMASDKGSVAVLCTPHKDSDMEMIEAECMERGIGLVLYSAEERQGELYEQ